MFNDPFREEIIQHFNVNAGAIYGVSESFWMSIGLGWAVARPLRRYFDSTGILGGNPGDYWIRDDDQNSVNLILGMSWAFRRTESSKVLLSLGSETNQRGVVIGIGKTL